MRWAWPLLLVSACTSADHSFLHLPERDASTTSLIAIFEREGSLEAIASDADSPRFDSDRQGILRITLFGYEEPLIALGMSAGTLPLAPPDVCGRRALPPASSQWVADLQAGDGAFVSGAEVPLATLGARLRVPCPCVTLRTVGTATLETQDDAYSLLAVDDHSVVARSNKSYLIDDSATILDAVTIPVYLTSGYRGPDGRLWYGTGTSTLAVGAWNRLDMIGLGGRDTWWIDGPHDASAPFELAILDLHGGLSLYDGLQRRVLWDVPVASSMQRGGVAWLGTGEVVASQEDGLDLLWLKGGQRVVVDPWDRARGNVSGLDWVGPPYDVVIGTATGKVYAGRPNAWRELERRVSSTLDAPLRGFTAFRGGMIGVGESSTVVQHHPDAGFCPGLQFNLGIDFHEVVAMGDRIYVAGHPTAEGEPGSAVMSAVLVLQAEGPN